MDCREKVEQAINKVKLPGTHVFSPFDVEMPEPVNGDRWGYWELDTTELTLTFDPSDHGREYWIRLDTINTSAQMLDWIFQLSGKTWMTPKDRADLLDAFEDILDPQATLCSGGESKTLNAKEYLRKKFAH